MDRQRFIVTALVAAVVFLAASAGNYAEVCRADEGWEGQVVITPVPLVVEAREKRQASASANYQSITGIGIPLFRAESKPAFPLKPPERRLDRYTTDSNMVDRAPAQLISDGIIDREEMSFRLRSVLLHDLEPASQSDLVTAIDIDKLEAGFIDLSRGRVWPVLIDQWFRSDEPERGIFIFGGFRVVR